MWFHQNEWVENNGPKSGESINDWMALGIVLIRVYALADREAFSSDFNRIKI